MPEILLENMDAVKCSDVDCRSLIFKDVDIKEVKCQSRTFPAVIGGNEGIGAPSIFLRQAYFCAKHIFAPSTLLRHFQAVTVTAACTCLFRVRLSCFGLLAGYDCISLASTSTRELF